MDSKIIKYNIKSFSIVCIITITSILALNLLKNQITRFGLVTIIDSLKSITLTRISLAFVLTIVYYIILGVYDFISIKYILANKIHIKLHNIFLVCFISNIIGNNLGYSMLFGGLIRSHFYLLYNLSIKNVTIILFFASLSIWLGFAIIYAILFSFANTYYMPSKCISIICIGIILLYCILALLYGGERLTIFHNMICVPNVKIIFIQIMLGGLDWLIVSWILYTLIGDINLKYIVLLKSFLISQFISVISQIPGGIGIFEKTMLYCNKTMRYNINFLAGLIRYRVIFYLIPLVIAIMLLIIFEIMNTIRKSKI